MSDLSRKKTLVIRSSPHDHSGASIDKVMWQVVYALLPVCVFSVYAFGWAALLILATAIVTCAATEMGLNRASRQSRSVRDGSIVITGLLYGLTLPPGLPLWMVALGAVVGVALGKIVFGGLGGNPFNPALVGQAFLQAAFPVAMTTWADAFAQNRFGHIPGSILAFPFLSPSYDQFSGATPLAAFKYTGTNTATTDLLLGSTSGSIGETSALLILICGAYLIWRGGMRWQIPAGILVAVVLLSGVLHVMDAARFAGPWFMLCSGGLMLGAMFMATDPVASPITARGCFLYGVLIGMLVVVLRNWSGLPEGVMYAILLANAVSPHIDRYTQPRPFGGSGKPGHHHE